ncbi:LacI family DNA-binding transcriptional regulator [Nioella sp.]|uniref:LacI family DNA-binding transcriptional regulator n=1 Tax=Nioella sp. TaxID=1912091 RepID=UPI003B51ED12
MTSDQNDSRRGHRVTLHDVASVAGVSKSTVSRVLDERLPWSDSETARKVRRVAQDLGYIRDVAAASLRRGQSMTIGVIVPRLTDTVMAMLYEALARSSARVGRFAMVATTEDDPGQVRIAAESLLRRGVDGLVLATAREGDDFPDELKDRGVPFVLALRTDGSNPSSVGDDQLGGYLATRHLLDLGHRRIGLIAGPDYASSARLRKAGYLQAMEEAGIPPDPTLIVQSTFGIESGAIAAKTLLEQPDRPTAVFAMNDNTAIGAMTAMLRLGLSVPEDVSLVGYNDIPLVRLLPTPLTTVRVPFDQIAFEAIDLLCGTVPRKESDVRKATPTVIPRQSTIRRP